MSRRAFFAATCATLAPIVAGCKTLNEDPNNKWCWFPTLLPPSKEEREARAKTFPDGGDPYVDAEVGPKCFDTRPRGWDVSRSKTSTPESVLVSAAKEE